MTSIEELNVNTRHVLVTTLRVMWIE